MYYSYKFWNQVRSPLLIILFSFQVIAQAQTPVASFTPDKITGCAPLLVNFTNTSTGATSYQWHFGNTNNSTILNPTTVYNSPGSYTVTLVAISATGLKDSATKNITVVNNPTASFSVAPLTGCEDVNVTSFTNASVNANAYTWDFGDGTTSSATNPVHTYITAGTYGIKLIATNSFGCQDIMIKSSYITIYSKPSAQFSVNLTSSCNITTPFVFTATGINSSTWHWNFGDGQSSSQQNPTHQYSGPGSYTVSLIVTNANGCADTIVKPNFISIGNTLVPSYTMSDTAGCGPLAVNFNCTVPNATSWLWNFGDGTSSSLQTPSHTYVNPGNYSVSLTVTTQSGCNGSVTVPASVIVDTPPVALFTVVQDSGCVPFTPQFINSSTGAATYLWQFGSVATDTAVTPVYTYNNSGLYTVTLHAYSPHGCESVQKIVGAIKALSISAHFTGTPLTGCPGMNVQFNTVNPQTNVISWNWSFGDGTFSTLQNPSHTYSAIGSYSVMLVVVTSFGCTDTVYRRNYVNVVDGHVVYTVPDTFKVCIGDILSFTDPTIGSDQWSWDFGNGTGSTQQSPSYLYPDTGIFTVTLNTSMPGGCSQFFNPYAIVQVITYHPEPIKVHYLNPCKPYTVDMSVATPDVVSYLWEFGDGDSSTLASPTHSYSFAGSYTITLTLTIGAGCRTNVDTTITFGHPNPIQVNNNNICLHDSSFFTLSTPAAFTNVVWHFDDGSTSALFNPTHCYLVKGSYSPWVITTDTSGCIDTFRIADPVSVSNPKAQFSISGSHSICLNAPLLITNLSTDAFWYFWDFGDGTFSTDSIPVHSYAVTGSYNIKLVVGSSNCSDSLEIHNAVQVVSPTCNFSFTTDGQCMPVTATYTDLSSPVTSWLWNFGDGDSSLAQNPIHTFNADPTGSVSLTVTDSNGCSSSQSKTNISFYAAGASINAATGCNPFNAQFTDLSANAISWLWDFGDGASSTSENPAHTYTVNNTYTVTLIATFPGNCKDTIVYPDMITVNTPHAAFFSPTVAGCSPTSISFTNISADATTFLWDFGDGGISLNINPSHIYYIPGTYTIKLIATNSFGCSDTLIKPDYITIPGTYAHFNIPTLSGCQFLNVAFQDSSINAVNWNWNFGDGYTGSVQHATHVYQDTGSFTVTLITYDSLGCSSSYSYPLPVVIHANPVAGGTVSISSGCSSFTTNFINQSQNATGYLWNFGDGDTSTLSNPAHTYSQSGNFQPSIIAITNFGCTDTLNFPAAVNVFQTPIAIISATDTVSCEPAVIGLKSASTDLLAPQYNWLFGNGNTASGDSVLAGYAVHGNYTAELIVTNSNGCADTASVNITIHPSPNASATADITEGCQLLPVHFTNQSAGATSYIWDFGNTDTSSQINTNYTYLQAGIFAPSLIATNQYGCRDTFYIPSGITIHQTPSAKFITDTLAGCNPTPIQFLNQSANLSNPLYHWDFGDGHSSTDTSTSHIYQNAGVYSVLLTVVNTFGCTDSTAKTITINQSPAALATIDDSTGCSPLTVHFTNQSSGASNYTWVLGNGNTDTTGNVNYSYLSGGVYQPQLIATASNGCRDTFAITTITVLQSPQAAFTSDFKNGCKNSAINFIDSSSMLQNPVYLWDFGFTTSTLQNPAINYPYSGIYPVGLTVTNANGCSDSVFNPSYLEIYDSLPPPADPILSVSVKNDTQVDVTWANSASSDLYSYILYRYDPATASYKIIYVSNPATPLSVSSTSVYTDDSLDTRHFTYTYKLQTTDICKNTLPLDSLTAHTTINITAVQNGPDIAVSWTPYIGCTLSTYELYRTQVSSGASQLVAILPSSTLAFTDTTLTCPFDYSYRVTATLLCGNNYNSLSDTSVARPENTLKDQKVTVSRSTVINNKSILTEWLPPVIHPERVAGYGIYRSDDTLNFSLIATVPLNATTFIDENVDVQKQEYYYRIEVINDCSLSGEASNNGSSIWLQGNKKDYESTFRWTHYKDWEYGVDHYILQQLDTQGNWIDIKNVDGNTTTVIVDE